MITRVLTPPLTKSIFFVAYVYHNSVAYVCHNSVTYVYHNAVTQIAEMLLQRSGTQSWTYTTINPEDNISKAQTVCW